MHLKILILYSLRSGPRRIAINNHLYSFKRYTQGIDYHYFNAIDGVPRYLSWVRYDAVILHYTFISFRYEQRKAFFIDLKKRQALKSITGHKILLAQDENFNLKNMWRILNEFRIKTVFSCALYKKDLKKIYPSGKTPLKHIFTILPGYVDEQILNQIKTSGLTKGRRLIDIGYRARKLPLWAGRAYQNKVQIGEKVEHYCQQHTNLKVDISTEEKDTIVGKDWYRFLGQCKAILGVESGSTLLSYDWSIRTCVEAYLKKHPNANYKEVESACFPNQDGKISYLTIGPRHFEAAMTKTCQILLEGKYADILKPGKHYIELKKDYSNLPEIIVKVQDKKYRQQIVDNAYQDLVLSGKYTYRVFANQVTDHICQLIKKGTQTANGNNQILFNFIGIILKLHPSYIIIRNHLDRGINQLYHLTSLLIQGTSKFILLFVRLGLACKQFLLSKQFKPKK